uniref:Uncharacterized protein n=1 Tax=Monopterus albus TaxID=43700 RepID=A0A3Q3K321_MONAL
IRRLGAVQQKIPCVFLTEMKEEQSKKRDGQVSGAATQQPLIYDQYQSAASMEQQPGCT